MKSISSFWGTTSHFGVELVRGSTIPGLVAGLHPASLCRAFPGLAPAGRGRPHPLGRMSGTCHHTFYTHPLGGNSPGRCYPGLLRAATHRVALAGTSTLFFRLHALVRSRRVLPAQPPVPCQVPHTLAPQGRGLARGSDPRRARRCSRRAVGRARLGGENSRSRSRSHRSLPGTLPNSTAPPWEFWRRHHTRREPGWGAFQELDFQELWKAEAWLWPGFAGWPFAVLAAGRCTLILVAASAALSRRADTRSREVGGGNQ